MGLDLTTASEALKSDYLPTIREQLNHSIMLLEQVEQNTEDVEGLEWVLNLHVGRNSGVGARRENGVLPTAGAQAYKKTRGGLKFQYGRIQISGPVIKAMKSDKGSWTRAVESESKGIVRDLKRDVNRQLYGTSDGVIAAAGVTTASTTVVLAATTTLVTIRQLEVGMVIDIGTVASPTAVASGRTITAVNRAAKTITISGAAVTTADTDRIFRSGSGGVGVEVTGLQSIVAASGTLQNVDPAVTPSWASQVFPNPASPGTLRSTTDTILEQAMDEVHIESGEDLNLFITTAGVRRNFASSLKSLKRFNDTVDLKGGFKGLSVTTGRGEVTLTDDRDAPSNIAFGLSTPNLLEMVESDWEFMDEDGAVLNRVPNTDAYEATLFKYHELVTDRRNAHCLITDLQES